MSLLGAHMSVAGGLCRAIDRAREVEAESIQIFTRNPLQWQSRGLADAEIEAFRRALLGSSVRSVVSHASYLINLAGDDFVRKKSRDALIAEVGRCYQLGIDAVVVHPGSSKGDRERALDRLSLSLGEVLERTEDTPVPILLETMAGQGDVLGSTIEELASAIERLGWDRRLGVCADMCHLFGAGYDMRSETGYNRLVSTLSNHLGLTRVQCWHLSDNRGTKGSHVDRHAHIGEGEIGVIPFSMLVSDERFSDTPTILETPKEGIGDEGNLALLRKLRGT